jgi:hypothetical protein
MPSYYRGGRLQVSVSGGEYYKVNCPFCGDTRKRLQFNYLWGTLDQRTRRRLLHLVICFNEDCLRNRARQLELWDRLCAVNTPIRRRARCVQPIATTRAPVPVRPPRLWDLNEPLPPEGNRPCGQRIAEAAAREYLAGRGFDPDELDERWGVWFARSSYVPRPAFRDRLVIPVYTLGPGGQSSGGQSPIVLAGWQARLVGEPTGDEPKYLTMAGMRKSALLYGLPQAVETVGPLVVCEGVSDVWRLGINSVAVFGNTVSDQQRGLLLAHFANRPIVILFDRESTPEAEEKTRAKAQTAASRLRRARSVKGDSSPVVIASPPEGRKDVGECSFEEAWTCVAAALRRTPSSLIVEVSEGLTGS